MSGGEARPFLRKHDKEAIRTDAREAKRQPLNADQQRALGQMSITDGVPIIREAPEGYTPWPIGIEGLAKIARDREEARPPLIDVIRASQGLDETDPQPAARPGTPAEWAEEEREWLEIGKLPEWMNSKVNSVLEHRSMDT